MYTGDFCLISSNMTSAYVATVCVVAYVHLKKCADDVYN